MCQVGATVLFDMVCPQSWPLHVPVGTAAWPSLAFSQLWLPQVPVSFSVPAWLRPSPSLALHTNQQVLQYHRNEPTSLLQNLPPDSLMFLWVLQPCFTWPTPAPKPRRRYCGVAQWSIASSPSFCMCQQLVGDAMRLNLGLPNGRVLWPDPDKPSSF